MDKKNSWKRTEEIEINLAELLRRFCMQWKRIAVCAVIFAVISGGCGLLKSRNSMKLAEREEAVLAQTEEIELTEAEKQAVADAVLLEKEIRGLETYLDNSVLMDIDPYHKKKSVMLYRISHVKKQEMAAVTESYLNFILNGGAADALKKSGSWKKDKCYLAELITAYTKTYGYTYQAAVEEFSGTDQLAESVFYVEITGKDDAFIRDLALNLQNVLDVYSDKAAKKAGEHKLTLVSCSENTFADSGLQSQQHEKKTLLSSNRANLRTMTDAFSMEQLAEYKKTAGLADIKEEAEDPGKAGGMGSMSEGIRYLMFGLAGGIFVYCGVYACWYVFSDMVKSAEEMKRMYTFPVYGRILLESGGRKRADAEYGICQVQKRIRIACRRHGIKKLYAVSDFVYGPKEQECLESMAEQLWEWGIELKVSENACTDTAVWDGLSEAGNVLMVCRIGTTTHRMIDEAMEFYLENGIRVIGAAAFLQNGRKKYGTKR